MDTTSSGLSDVQFDTLIPPSKQCGWFILSVGCDDRYVLSALAYQSAQGVDLKWLTDLNRYAMSPDVTVFVDTPIRTCLERIKVRGDSMVDIFHKRETLYRVRRQYLQVLSMSQFLGRLVTADGKADRYDVLRQVMGCDYTYDLLRPSHIAEVYAYH